MAKKVDSIMLLASVFGFLILAVSFLLMSTTSFGVLPGMLFWIGLMVGLITQVILEIRRRALFARYHVPREKMQKPRNGLLSFFSNPLAKIADIALLLSILTTVVVLIATNGLGYLCYICISATVFCFCMHCVLNGRIFFYVKNKNKIQHVLEETYASTKKKERKL